MCDHDFTFASEHRYKREDGIGYVFRTYQCWKCQGWGAGAVRVDNGDVVFKPENCAVDDREDW